MELLGWGSEAGSLSCLATGSCASWDRNDLEGPFDFDSRILGLLGRVQSPGQAQVLLSCRTNESGAARIRGGVRSSQYQGGLLE